MDQTVIARLEQCRSLPTIPAVALKIVELCQRDDFELDQLIGRASCRERVFITV